MAAYDSILRRTIIVNDEDSCMKACAGLAECKQLALNCEGLKLSRNGELSTMAIASFETLYLFDILVNRQSNQKIPATIISLLSDDKVDKLMFDCREDADILYHQLGIQLSGVIDLQIMDCMNRYPLLKPGLKISSLKYASKFCTPRQLWAEYGVLKGSFRESDFEISMKRPIDPQFVRFNSLMTDMIFRLFTKLQNSPTLKTDNTIMEKVKIYSAAYANGVIHQPCREFGPFHKHGFMPYGILTSRPEGDIICTGCKWSFPSSEFSDIQLKKQEQKCKVCQAVQLNMDLHARRTDAWINGDI